MTTGTCVSKLVEKSLRSWSPTWCAEADARQHAVVGETGPHAEERRAEHGEQRHPDQADRDGALHHEFR